MEHKSKQVMDIRASKGISSGESNEELRRWTDRGWQEAESVGNYDRSRENLNFEIDKGGIVRPVDKKHSLACRMAENLAARGIKDPNEGLDEPKYRTAVNFIFGGSRDRMRELAFGKQVVNFDKRGVNGCIQRMPEIELWARDVYDFVADKYGEQNIVSFIVHLDEKNPHVHCTLLPIDKDGKFAFKRMFAGKDKYAFKRNTLKLHDELAKVNEKWGLFRGDSITDTGVKHRSTEDYRRWLAGECDSLEQRKEQLQKALRDLNTELSIAEKKQKSFTTMIENLSHEKETLEEQLQSLRDLQKNSSSISQELVQKIQDLEDQKAKVETKLAEKTEKLHQTEQDIDQLRKDKAELETEAEQMAEKAKDSELDFVHNRASAMNELIAGTVVHEFTSRYEKLPDSSKAMFQDTLLEQFATEGNHVAAVAVALMCEYVEQATSIAESHGGGGGPKGGWRKRDDEDDRMFARRSLAYARQMCRPAAKRKKL